MRDAGFPDAHWTADYSRYDDFGTLAEMSVDLPGFDQGGC